MSKVRLGDVAEERKETCKQNVDGYPIVGLEHLIPEDINLTEWSEGVENTFSKLFREGDVLFGRRRAYLKKAAVAPFDGICSGDITVIKPFKGKIRPELLPFVIQNDNFFDFAVGKSAGSLSPRVKWEHLRNYEFNLPDSEEQKELAKVLWAMDATKRSYQKLLQKTDELAKSQFTELFGDYPQDSLMKNIVGSIRTGKLNANAAKEDGIYPFFTCDSKPKKINKYAFDTEAILVSGNGSQIGHINYYSGKFNAYQRTYVLSDFTEQVNVKYLFEYYKIFLKSYIVDKSIGTAIPYITLPMLENFMISVPTLDIQKVIVDFAEQSDRSKLELGKALDELTAVYKKTISENLG